MPVQAPRLDPRLVAALPHLDDERLPIAETNRRVGALALAIGVPRPSYQQVRVRVREARTREFRRRKARREAVELILEVQFRRRPPEALFDLLAPDRSPLAPK